MFWDKNVTILRINLGEDFQVLVPLSPEEMERDCWEERKNSMGMKFSWG